MDYNKQIRNTWIMVTLVTAIAFIISGIIQLKYQEIIWPAVMNFSSALVLLIFSFVIMFKSKRIFKNPAFYVVFYFFGYVLILVGLMTTINKAIWGSGIFFMLLAIYIAFSKKTIKPE